MKNRFLLTVLIICLTATLSSCQSKGSGPAGSPPSPITGISVTPGNDQTTINWIWQTPNWQTSPASSYNIYWATAPGVTKATGAKISGITGATFTHTGLSNGATYYYVITAQNANGESAESIEFRATPSALLSAYIAQPIAGALADTLQIVVTDSATYQMQEINATVEDHETSLVYSTTANCGRYGCGPGWAGTISLDGLTRGEKLLVVTATDVFNNTTMASVSFTYDKKPVIVISEPLDYSVARPQLHIAASCTDDDPAGCSSLTVSVPPEDLPSSVVASGQATIDQTISLASFDGTSVNLTFTATDSAGQVTTLSRSVFVESSTKLNDVASVKGPIWDMKPDRILFLDTSGGGNALTIEARSSGADTVVMNEAGKVPQYGSLTSHGAIFQEGSTSVDSLSAVIHEWRDGGLLDLCQPTNSSNHDYSTCRLGSVKGDYAIFNNFYWHFVQQYADNDLILRDLLSGTSTTVATTAGPSDDDVATDGTVVYWGASSPYQIFRYQSGVTTQLTSDSGLWNLYPVTDGINVVYLKQSPCCSKQTYTLTIFTSSGELPLGQARPNPMPNTDYQVNNGWAAFTRVGVDGVSQVWLRSPAGDVTQLSFFGSSTSIDALGPNGDATLISRYRRYYCTSGAMPIDVGSSQGKSFYQDGQWYAIIGRSLFSITP